MLRRPSRLTKHFEHSRTLIAVIVLCVAILVVALLVTPPASTSAPVRPAEVPISEARREPVRLELTLRPSPASREEKRGPEVAYESLDSYIDAFKRGDELKGPGVLFEIAPKASEPWARYFGATRWRGGSGWGVISFDKTGRRATFTNDPGFAPGILLIQGSPRGSASYVVGEWRQEDGQKGWMAILEMEEDPQSHKLTSVMIVWGDGVTDSWEPLP